MRAILLLIVLTAGALATPPDPAAEPRRWIPVLGESRVVFDVRHRLGDLRGRGEVLEGEFTSDPDDLRRGITGWLRAAAGALTTGQPGRDRDLKRALAVDRHPEIRFAIDKVVPSFGSLSDRSDVLLTIQGTLFLHGVERAVTVLGRARLRDGRPWVRGETTVRLTQFGIDRPRHWFLPVADEVVVGADLTLAPAQ